MLSSKIPYQWQGGFGGANDGFQAASVDQQALTELPVSSKIDVDVSPDDNFRSDQYYGSTFFDSDEYKARAKRMAAGLKFGSPGHSRVQGLQRMRRHSSSQHLQNINPCATIPPTDRHKSRHKSPHGSESLPATMPGDWFPIPGNIPEGEDAYWYPSTVSEAKPEAPREQSFADDLLDI